MWELLFTKSFRCKGLLYALSKDLDSLPLEWIKLWIDVFLVPDIDSSGALVVGI